MGIFETAEQIRTRRVSPEELTRQCLSQIQRLNPTLNAFITVLAESALEEARQAEREIESGNWRGPLHGIPIGLKDLIDTAGVRTTAASALFKDRIPAADAEVVRRLRAAGAVLIGKQNLHELAYGGSSIVSYFGKVRNPWNPEYIAGGSSGGSAAAVAAGLGYGAIGTDTAGSIRQPAAISGVVGLKPTYARVSAQGVIPLAPSLDHVGPIAATVADAALLLQSITSSDRKDSSAQDYLAALESDTRQLRVGVPRSFFYQGVDREIGAAVNDALRLLGAMVGEVRETSLSVPTDRTLQAAESYEFHAQFIRETPDLYQKETLDRIRSGQGISPEERDRLRRELARARESVRDAFLDSDVLITPTVPEQSPSIRELQEKPETLRARELSLLRNTRPFNVWGLPAISIPCGFTNLGLPIGLQIIGPPGGEPTVLALAHAYEQATQWHKRRPKITASTKVS